MSNGLKNYPCKTPGQTNFIYAIFTSNWLKSYRRRTYDQTIIFYVTQVEGVWIYILDNGLLGIAYRAPKFLCYAKSSTHST